MQRAVHLRDLRGIPVSLACSLSHARTLRRSLARKGWRRTPVRLLAGVDQAAAPASELGFSDQRDIGSFVLADHPDRPQRCRREIVDLLAFAVPDAGGDRIQEDALLRRAVGERQVAQPELAGLVEAPGPPAFGS